MKRALILLLLLNHYLYSDDIINIKYPSSNTQNIIYYKGSDRFGEGSFFYINNNENIIILTEYLRYCPMLNWITNAIAEIKIPTGSPNYHVYYFDFNNKILSKSFNLAISNDPINRNVACLDQNEIIIYDMFSGNIKKEYPINNLEPLGFLVFCEYESSFLSNNTFQIKWKCPEQDDYKERIISF